MRYIKTSKEYNSFQVDVSDNSVTAYRVEISFGIASVKECIQVDSNLNIKLSYEGSPIPLPSYIDQAQGARLASLDMLTNLPVYCKNAEEICETDVIKELIKLILQSTRKASIFS